MTARRPLVSLLPLGVLISLALASCSSAAKPVPTLSAVIASTPLPSPAPTPLPSNVAVERQSNGTTVVDDVGNGYQFTLTQQWMAIPPTKEQIEHVSQASPPQDAEFVRLAIKLGEETTDAFRLVGINTDSKFAHGANPSLLLVTAIPDKSSSTLPMTKVASMIRETVFTDSNGVSQDVVHNANGIDVAVVEGPYDYLSTQGDTLKTRSKVIGFQANERVILIQFITPEEFGAEVLPGTDQIIDTIRRTAP